MALARLVHTRRISTKEIRELSVTYDKSGINSFDYGTRSKVIFFDSSIHEQGEDSIWKTPKIGLGRSKPGVGYIFLVPIDRCGPKALKEVRARGETAEAATRERASIRMSLDVIRKTLATRGAYVSPGAGGTTIHYAKGCTLQGYGRLRHMAVAQVLVDLGLPLIDTTPVANELRLIDLPLVAVGRDPDPEPWSSLSYAPLGAYAGRAKALGAVVANWARGEDRPVA